MRWHIEATICVTLAALFWLLPVTCLGAILMGRMDAAVTAIMWWFVDLLLIGFVALFAPST